MTYYQPTFGVRETSEKIKNYMRETRPIFWDVYRPLIPYFLGCSLIDLIGSAITGSDFVLGKIIVTYFTFALMISWHRVVIHGTENYVPVNPLKPKRSELAFMGMGLLLGVLVVVGILFTGLIGAIAGPVGAVLLVIVAMPIMVFVISRFSFYFPAKATEVPLTLGQAYRLTNGYILKMFLVGIMTQLRWLLILVIYFLIATPVAFVVAYIFGEGTIMQIATGILALPIDLYWTPITTVIAVTVLSNYYQHAMQNNKEFYKQS